MSESEDEPKLIIDEDWKSKVQREKEEVQQTPPAESEADAAAQAEQDLPPLPPASLPLLVTSLATQAMAALGQIPTEEGKPPTINLEYGRHIIDLIGVVEEKTAGNLTDEESKYLQDTLHQLRMLFVSLSQQQ